jgi:hypothetical protein
MKLESQDTTIIHTRDGGQEVSLQELIDQGGTSIIYVTAFGRYLIVFDNGQMLIGLETTRSMFLTHEDGDAPVPTWRLWLSVAAAVLVSQIAVYFLSELTGITSPLIRSLVAATLTVAITLFV